MKYAIILLALIALVGQGFSQSEETYYTIKNPQTGETRVVSQADLSLEMNSFKESALRNGAYYDEKGALVIPLNKEKKEISDLQRVLSRDIQTREDGGNCSWREQWGDSTFGAEAYIEITNSGTKDSFNYSAAAGIKATIFSNELTIIELTSDCTADTGAGEGNSPDTNGTTKVILFGKVVFSETNPKLEYEYKQEDLTMFEYSQLFWIGPVPVTVSAKLTGNYGFKFSASACLGAAAGVIKTFGGIDLNLEAEAGISGVLGLDVTVELRLIYLEIRAKAIVYLASFESFIIEGNVNLDLKSLDGTVYIFFEFLFQKYNQEIFSWTGIEKSWELWSHKKEYSF